jgi:hypothetical protein
VGTDAAQVGEPLDESKKVLLRDVILKRKRVKQRWLCCLPGSHHRQSFPQLQELNQQFSPRSRKSFSTKCALTVSRSRTVSLGQQSGLADFTLKGRRWGLNHSNGQNLPAKCTTKQPKTINLWFAVHNTARKANSMRSH